MKALSLFLLALAAPPVGAALAGESGYAAQVLQMLIGLAVVLVLIALATFAARRLRTLRPIDGGHIRVVEGLALGAREKLLLVEVDGRRVLLALSPGRIQPVTDYAAAAQTAGAQPEIADFAASLASAGRNPG